MWFHRLVLLNIDKQKSLSFTTSDKFLLSNHCNTCNKLPYVTTNIGQFQKISLPPTQKGFFKGPPLEITIKLPGLKIMSGHRTVSGQDNYLFGQNLCLLVFLTGHVCCFQTINWKKIICFIFEKYKQFNHKSQQLVVTNTDFSIFFK